jgi:hypothetical protein
MSTNPIDWEAVIADLEAKKAQLDSAIQAIRGISNLGVLAGTIPTAQNGTVPPDAFLGMSIPEATKKLLGIVRKRLATPDIVRMLSQGGLPEPAYNTAYAVLRRRQQQVGDIININGDWGLREWTPGYNPPKKKAAAADEPKEDIAALNDALDDISDRRDRAEDAQCKPPVIEEEGVKLA